MGQIRDIAGDALTALRTAAVSSAPRLFRSWVLVPSGLMVILVACFGIDALLRLAGASFPPSVACLGLLFGALLLSEWALGGHRTRRIVSVIDIPANWALRWMSLFFTPSFVLLPLSEPIGAVEVFKIIAVFVVGFFVTMALVAYLTRSLQALVGSSKRALAQRAEEVDPTQDLIPLTGNPSPTPPPPPPGAGHGGGYASTPSTTPPGSGTQTATATPVPSRPQTPPQLRIQDHHHGQADAGGPAAAPAHTLTESLSRQGYPSQQPVPPVRSERWAAAMTAHIDACTYAALLVLVGIPVYYAAGYAMPLHLTVNTLAYAAASTLPPPRWRTYLHPILTSALITVLAVWALGATRGLPLDETLADYRTGAKYIQVWRSAASASSPPPGAGDVFATLLDASIASLALPTFQHRRELRAHLVPLLVPSVLVSVASLFVYPPVSGSPGLGIGPARSLAFVPRSLTLALATPAAENLDADVQAAAAFAIVSGILGVLCGQRVLALLRIPDDDYVTRGITLGINSSAMATALLLKTDPRAAALSCLAMVLFGTITVVFTSIPAVSAFIQSLAGL